MVRGQQKSNYDNEVKYRHFNYSNLLYDHFNDTGMGWGCSVRRISLSDLRGGGSVFDGGGVGHGWEMKVP